MMYLYQKFRQHSLLDLNLMCPKSNKMGVIGARKPLRKTAQHLNDIHCERDTFNCYEKAFLSLVIVDLASKLKNLYGQTWKTLIRLSLKSY